MGDIVKAIEPHLTKIAADADRLPADLRDLHASPAKELDAMTMDVYLTSIGVTGWIRSLIDIAFVTEYGLEMNEQSALNLITLIGTDIFDGELKFFGESDERYVLIRWTGSPTRIWPSSSAAISGGICPAPPWINSASGWSA
jgi:monoamine oxidase